MLSMHPWEPLHPFSRHPVNLILHRIIQAKGQILLKPIWQGQGHYQCQRDHQIKTQRTGPDNQWDHYSCREDIGAGKNCDQGEAFRDRDEVWAARKLV